MRFPISAIVDAGSHQRDWLGNVQQRIGVLSTVRNPSSFVDVEAIEAALPAPIAARDTFDPVIGQFAMVCYNAGLHELPTYVELPRTSRFEELLPSAMFALARSKLGAKLRCGGVEQAAFPSVGEIAAFLLRAKEYGVPFKATAGLHHPIRGVDRSSGLMMHGFLNLLTASIAAQQGADCTATGGHPRRTRRACVSGERRRNVLVDRACGRNRSFGNARSRLSFLWKLQLQRTDRGFDRAGYSFGISGSGLNSRLQSWVSVPADSDFPLENLPYGVFESQNQELHIGVAIGNSIFDLHVAANAGLFDRSFHRPLDADRANAKLTISVERTAMECCT